METVSVIIPAYNCKDFLEQCVVSVLSANEYCGKMFIHELILIDDGSTDGSSTLCDELAAAKSTDLCTVRVIHQVNQGVSTARNEGLRAATGSFVFFVDSDDTVDPQKLAELMERLSEDAGVDMAVFGLSFDYYHRDRIYRQDVKLPPVEGIKSFDECREMLYSLFASNMLSPLCNKLIRKSVIDQAGLGLCRDMFLYEDLEFSLRVLARCSSVCFFAEPIYQYRQPPDENNAGRRLKRVPHIPEIVDKIENALVPFGGNTEMLLSLYLILAREKISVATGKEAAIVCSDFRAWVDRHELKHRIGNSKLAALLYSGSVQRLLFRRKKTKIRHRLANWIKQNFGDYRKHETQRIIFI